MANDDIKKISNVIGLPLSNLMERDLADKPMNAAKLQKLALPKCVITPCTMEWGDGFKTFKLARAQEVYTNLLRQHFIAVDGVDKSGLHVYFYPESSITETFQNNYGDTFIANYLKTFGNEALTDLNQMIGGGMKNLLTQTAQQEGMLGNIANSVLGAERQLANLNIGGANIGSYVTRALSGQRFDFPMVWKSSAFSANYSLNIKLFNPHPTNSESVQTYLVAPLGALLCLGLPIGQGDSYSWPLVHQLQAPGFFMSKGAAIQNITVTKGGDQNLHTFDGPPTMIEVKIDFVNLYDPMIAGDTSGLDYRTNLSDYLENIWQSKIVSSGATSTQATPPATPAQGLVGGGAASGARIILAQ